MKLLTIFADASWWAGAGGYAYWARGDGRDRLQGSAPWPCASIDEVETVAISVAIIEALDKLPFLDGGGIVAQSDSLHALGLLMAYGGIAAKSSDRPIKPFCFGGQHDEIGKTFARKAMEEAKQRSARVYLKHIKGHTGKDEARSHVNEWCDSNARAARRRCAFLIEERAKTPAIPLPA